MGKYDDLIGGGKLILDVEEVLNEESAKKVDDRIKKQKAELEKPVEITVNSEAAVKQIKELTKAASKVKQDLHDAMSSGKEFKDLYKLVSQYETLGDQIKKIAPSVSKGNSALKECNKILRETKGLVDKLTGVEPKAKKTKKKTPIVPEIANTAGVKDAIQDAEQAQEKRARTTVRTQDKINAALDKEKKKLEEIDALQSRNEAARQRFKKKQENYGKEVLGVDTAVYDTDLLKDAQRELKEFNDLLATRNRFQEKYIKLHNIIERNYVDDTPGKHSIGNGMYDSVDRFYDHTPEIRELEKLNEQGQKTTNKYINGLFASVVRGLERQADDVARLIASGDVAGDIVAQRLEREETELNSEMQQLHEARQEQLRKINELRQEEIALIKQAGQAEAANAAQQKKSALNMEKVIKRYNNLMNDVGREHLTIGTEFSQGTEKWNLRDMVSEAQWQIDYFHADDAAPYDADERRMWRNEGARLQRFVNTYGPLSEGIIATTGHGGTKWDNYTKSIDQTAQALQIVQDAFESLFDKAGDRLVVFCAKFSELYGQVRDGAIRASEAVAQLNEFLENKQPAATPTKFKLTQKKDENGYKIPETYTALDGKFEISRGKTGWDVFQSDNVGALHLIGNYKTLNEVRSDASLLAREEIVVAGDVAKEVQALAGAYDEMAKKAGGSVEFATQYVKVFNEVKSGALSSADAIKQLNEFVDSKFVAKPEVVEPQIQSAPVVDEDELEIIQKENGALEDRLELLQEIAEQYGNVVTQRDRDRYEELNQKDMDGGLTTREEERFWELGEAIDDADRQLEEFGATYSRIVLKLENGKKIEILPDDAGLRKLAKFNDEWGNTYNGIEIEEVVFERVHAVTAAIVEQSKAIEEVAEDQNKLKFADGTILNDTQVAAVEKYCDILKRKMGEAYDEAMHLNAALQLVFDISNGNVANLMDRFHNGNPASNAVLGLLTDMDVNNQQNRDAALRSINPTIYDQIVAEQKEAAARAKAELKAQKSDFQKEWDEFVDAMIGGDAFIAESNREKGKILKEFAKYADTAVEAMHKLNKLWLSGETDGKSGKSKWIQDYITHLDAQKEYIYTFRDSKAGDIDIDAFLGGNSDTRLTEESAKALRDEAAAWDELIASKKEYYGIASNGDVVEAAKEIADATQQAAAAQLKLTKVRNGAGQIVPQTYSAVGGKYYIDKGSDGWNLYEANADGGLGELVATYETLNELRRDSALIAEQEALANQQINESAEVSQIVQLVDNYGKELDEVNNKLMQGVKLLNEQAQVLRLFHNSPNIFDAFDASQGKPNQGQALGAGNYLALGQNGEYNTLDYGRYQTQWYANVQSPFNVGDRLTDRQSAYVIDKFMADRAESFKQHMLSKLTENDVVTAIKDIAEIAGTTVGEIFTSIGYDSITDGVQINVFDSSKIHRANDSVLDIGTAEFDALRELQKQIWEEQKIIRNANDQIHKLSNQYAGKTAEELESDLFTETLIRGWDWQQNVAKIASAFKDLTGELPKSDSIPEESMLKLVENYEFARQSLQDYQNAATEHGATLDHLTAKFFEQEAKINEITQSYLAGNISGIVNVVKPAEIAAGNQQVAQSLEELKRRYFEIIETVEKYFSLITDLDKISGRTQSGLRKQIIEFASSLPRDVAGLLGYGFAQGLENGFKGVNTRAIVDMIKGPSNANVFDAVTTRLGFAKSIDFGNIQFADDGAIKLTGSDKLYEQLHRNAGHAIPAMNDLYDILVEISKLTSEMSAGSAISTQTAAIEQQAESAQQAAISAEAQAVAEESVAQSAIEAAEAKERQSQAAQQSVATSSGLVAIGSGTQSAHDIYSDLSAQVSTSAIEAATDAIYEEGVVAEQAAAKKDKFTEANKRVAQSGQATKDGVDAAAGAMENEGKSAKEYADTVISALSRMNSLNKEIDALSGKNQYGFFSKQIDSMQQEKATLLGEVFAIAQEVNEKFNLGFSDDDLSQNFLGVLKVYFDEAGKAAAISGQEVNKFADECRKADKFAAELRSRYQEAFLKIKELREAIAGSGTSLGSDEDKKKDDGGMEYYRKMLEKYLVAQTKYDSVLSEINGTDPINWSGDQSMRVNNAIAGMEKYGSVIKKIIDAEREYFAGKQQYIGGDTTMSSMAEDAENAANKTSKAKQELVDAAHEFAQASGASGAIVTKFVQGADGIAKLDFSVLEKGTNTLHKFQMAAGRATEGIHITETTADSQAASIVRATSQLERVGALINKVKDAGADMSQGKFAELVEAFNKLDQALSAENQDVTVITKAAQDCQMASPAVEKLYNKMQKLKALQVELDSETSQGKSLDVQIAARERMLAVKESLGALGAGGINVSDDGTAHSSIQKVLDKYKELENAIKSGNADDNTITRLTQDLKILSKEVEKTDGRMRQMQSAIENGQATRHGSIDPNGDIYSQLISKMQSYATTSGAASVQIGKFDAATGTLNASLIHTNGTVEQVKMSMYGLNGECASQQVGVTKLTTSWDKFKASIGQAGKQLLTALVGYNVFYKAISEVRKGIGYVKEIDLALTELKKVTDETEDSYKNFLNTAADTAGKIGSTISDFTEASANFARLG